MQHLSPDLNHTPTTDADTAAVTTSPKSGVVSIRLPTFVLVHGLSLAGLCGGAYQVTRPNTAVLSQLQADVDQLKSAQAQNTLERAAILDRLARIETNTDNIRDGFKEIRQSIYRLRN